MADLLNIVRVIEDECGEAQMLQLPQSMFLDGADFAAGSLDFHEADMAIRQENDPVGYPGSSRADKFPADPAQSLHSFHELLFYMLFFHHAKLSARVVTVDDGRLHNLF